MNKPIELEGTIQTVLPGTMFRVVLDNQHEVLAHISGKMRRHFVRLTVGDRVRIEMSPTTCQRRELPIGYAKTEHLKRHYNVNSFFFFWAAVGFVVAIVFASFFEWTMHRFLMHRRVNIFSYPFEKHAMVHHQIFKADETYHLIKEEDKYTIPMAWWNGPAIIAVGIIPFVVAAVVLKSWGIICGSLFACFAYYGAYEYMHWCMHLPRKRAVETLWDFLPA